jgi:NAD+-dependent protein deacetylase sirtuin 4
MHDSLVVHWWMTFLVVQKVQHLQHVPVLRPDGDVELGDAGSFFRVPACPVANCGGVLKPDVVFFGDSVPLHKADAAAALASRCDAVLVVGSSVSTYSAFRHVKRMAARGAAVAAINVGATRADELLQFKVEAKVGEVLMRLATHPTLLLPRPLQ